MKKFFVKNLFYIYILCMVTVPSASWASVTMIGNRIIYPSDAKSVDVQMKNNDDFPYVVQTWFDDGDINSQPQKKSDVPMISTPPVFRIQGESGQIVRIVFNKFKQLPTDRETLYWFNSLQIPPSNISANSKKNEMLVMLRNRVKVFYRPDSIGKPKNILKGLKVEVVKDKLKGNGVKITNPQPWYASITNISFSDSDKNIKIPAEMIAPFSEGVVWMPKKYVSIAGEKDASVTAINDQGAMISENFKVKF